MNKTVKQIQAGLAAGEFSSAEITRDYLDRINALNPSINALISITDELAMQQARDADALIAADKANDKTARVSTGSITPSSQSLALA